MIRQTIVNEWNEKINLREKNCPVYRTDNRYEINLRLLKVLIYV